MFEAVITLCLGLSGEPCRDHLLPGAEAATQAECEAILTSDPRLQAIPEGLVAQGPARCQEVGTTLDFTEVAPGVHAHRGAIDVPNAENKGDVTNLGFVIGAQSVAVIDTGTARWMGEATWRAIRARTDLPVSHVILTHMHPDHVLGASLFADAGAEIVGHAALPRALSDRVPNYTLKAWSVWSGRRHFSGRARSRLTEASRRRSRLISATGCLRSRHGRRRIPALM